MVIVLSNEKNERLKLKNNKKNENWMPKAKVADDKLVLKIFDTKCTVSEIKNEKCNGKPANVKSASYTLKKKD